MEDPAGSNAQPAVSTAVPASGQLLETQELLRLAQQELQTLYAALDNVHSGLLILDGNLRARYSNPVLHTMFNAFSAQQIRHERPFYGDMLQGAASGLAVNVEDYVARRLAWVVSGDTAPMDLTMSNGTVLRCQLAILPDGGRMLIYSDVTDIIRNAEAMEQLATVDGMTGIYNRRHFLILADREWDRARRYARPLSFLMIDIDFFKAINDRYGHEVGDRAIVHVANLARGCKRATDVLARIGGEEFALLLPETDLGQAQLVAERLRCEVARSPLIEVAHPATVSIGVAAADQEMANISDLMKTADQALYAAKHSGRNKVVCSIAGKASPGLASGDGASIRQSENSSG
jgi:diguanylate cyclase (GGDEF)-like protein